MDCIKLFPLTRVSYIPGELYSYLGILILYYLLFPVYASHYAWGDVTYLCSHAYVWFSLKSQIFWL